MKQKRRIVQNMKATMIKKYNLIISLWLIAIVALLCIFGYQLGANGCYVAAAVFGGLLLISNSINLVSGVITNRVSLTKTENKYNQ